MSEFIAWWSAGAMSLCSWFIYEFIKETKESTKALKQQMIELKLERVNFDSAVNAQIFQLKNLNQSLTTSMLSLRSEFAKMKSATDELHVKAKDCNLVFNKCLDVAKSFNGRLIHIEKDVVGIKVQVFGKKYPS